MPTLHHPLSQQRGAALFLTLCIVVALMLMGASAVRTALNAERSARGDRDRHIALQAAEAALEDAERDIEGGSNPGSQRAAMFAPGPGTGFVAGCGSGADNLGLCMRTSEPAAPAWQRAALASKDSPATVPYGFFTAAVMPHGVAGMPARLPRYVIELLPTARAGHDASAPPANCYRITAIGFGASETTWVVLQSFYLKGALA
jgi:Tfp pilus assembly protein PilX